MRAVIDLEACGLTAASLPEMTNLATVRIHLAYPNYKELIHFSPADRRKQVAAQLRQEYQKVKAHLSGLLMERLGSQVKPRGMMVQLPLYRLTSLLNEEAIGNILIESIENWQQPEVPKLVPESSFWCVKARFAVQIEGKLSGLQTFEERILLVKATAEEEAKEKLLATFDRYAEPYLNSNGELVRWQFEDFLAVEGVSMDSLDAAAMEGVEVFSTLGTRRIKPGMAWVPGTPASWKRQIRERTA